ncbi:hypothetical protein HF086_012258 [Spodoptera exigua]|uniref:Uncharacterized protein n=1 Tax=Spodoptera exigua TaxID=7107 RepID=A0A922MFP5_SPOEX|nr:hypothetical protein HF086_012258 [Spodoptera exigua]
MSTRNLNQEERNQIIILHGQGLNISQIAVELNLQELLIIEKGKKSGSGTHEIYKPSIKFFDSMDYIMKIINLKEKETLSNLEPNHASTSGNEDLDASDNRNKAVPTKVVRPPKTPKLKTKVSSERSEIQAAVNELKELNISLLNVSAPIPRELEDECDVIGRHVALQLKQLPPIDRIDATDEIQAILSRYRKSTLCARIMLIILYTPSDYSSECTPSKQPAANYQLVGPTISAHSTQLEQSSQSILHNECTLSSQSVVFAAPVNPSQTMSVNYQPVEPTISAHSTPLLDQSSQSILRNDILSAAISISKITK